MKNGRVLVRLAMIGLDTERPETITIGTNELIGTDPNKLPRAIDGGAVEPHGLSLLHRSSVGYEGRAAVVPLVSLAKPAEASA